jgi:hypothetical protein
MISKWGQGDILDRGVISHGLVDVVTRPRHVSFHFVYAALYTFYAAVGKAIAYLGAEMAQTEDRRPAKLPARRACVG